MDESSDGSAVTAFLLLTVLEEPTEWGSLLRTYNEPYWPQPTTKNVIKINKAHFTRLIIIGSYRF